ncbi:hypothetical protein GCM10009854_08400 [Saccharopolyspora halophila]|uniref:Uncharacterized protein n=1 Tax=Saccharopolyspora halophila TaxID=405551 RepID=A0ABP5SQT0_9PSEU
MNRNRALLVLPFALWLVVAFTLPGVAWLVGSWMTFVTLIATIALARQRKSVRPTTWIGLGFGFALLVTALLLGPQPAGRVALAAGVLVTWTSAVRTDQHFYRAHHELDHRLPRSDLRGVFNRGVAGPTASRRSRDDDERGNLPVAPHMKKGTFLPLK